MSNFLLTSIVGSIILTVLLNVLPALFPNASANLQRKIEQNARRALEQHEDSNRPNVKVFFPWKAMLIGSIVLTIFVNLVGWFSQH